MTLDFSNTNFFGGEQCYAEKPLHSENVNFASFSRNLQDHASIQFYPSPPSSISIWGRGGSPSNYAENTTTPAMPKLEFVLSSRNFQSYIMPVSILVIDSLIPLITSNRVEWV
jgi:hypothetical protein